MKVATLNSAIAGQDESRLIRNARSLVIAAVLLGLNAGSSHLAAADFPASQALFDSGEYQQCLQNCDVAIADNGWSEQWWILKLRTQLEIGDYQPALETLESALKKFSSSVQLRWLGHRVYRFNGEVGKAATLLDKIEELANAAPWRYSDAPNRVILGQYLLHSGYDAKQVLDAVYDQAKKDRPTYAETYIAAAELALSKSDYGLAAEELRSAVKHAPKDPRVHQLLAEALSASDGEKATQSLAKALELNPRHTASLLMLVDQHVDSENYDQARRYLAKVLTVNIRHPLAWAYHAVLCHLEAEHQGELLWRRAGLAWDKINPEVDHLIGRKLSQKYRFAEGAKYQERSLRLDPKFIAAKIQLSQDYLRLGNEEQGCKLAREVYAKDGYNVVAHNLVTLEKNIKRFRTLEAEGFHVRMEAREAAIYGDRVLRLLSRARKVLCAKYDVKLQEPTIVEIFPQQKDFAIRTFGLPGGDGFLGVCFGRVITANSPASQGENPSNWEAVLWHEFCHVVTLQKTKNRMPRWLSEGISVYEELQADSRWGQVMTPTYRQMILGDDLTPVSQLSAAFLRPASAVHLQFAYFESAMVVDYLVQTHGLETVQRILTDLSAGMPINPSLQRYCGSLEKLDVDFARFARGQAKDFASEANWDKLDLPADASLDDVHKWNEAHPDNLEGLRREASLLLRAEQWKDGLSLLQRYVQLYPQERSNSGAYAAMALAYRKLDDEAGERKVLKTLSANYGDALPAYLRLMDIAAAEKNWKEVRDLADQALAVNPLISGPHQHLATAAEALKDRPATIDALRSLLQLNPVDPAESHFRLAKALVQEEQLPAARRQVLKALEAAPRYREAHRLLLEIVQRPAESADATDDPKAADTAVPAEKATAAKATAAKQPANKTPKSKAATADTPKDDTKKPETKKPETGPPKTQDKSKTK